MSEPKPMAGQDDNGALLGQLESFLEEQADDHRHAMEQVVVWLQRAGSLEREIHRSVASLGNIFQKWSFEILFLLRIRGTLRFNQLREELTSVQQKGVLGRVKEMAGVGSRTLSERLKDLESHGLVHREAIPEVPVRVEYSLTPRGRRFGDLMMPVIAYLRMSEARAADPGT